MTRLPEYVLGFDPGRTGGYAAIDTATGQAARVWTMPLAGRRIDWRQVAMDLDAFHHAVAYVEKVNAMPKQGVSSTFAFGASYGGLQGLLAAMSIPYELVAPKRWQMGVLKDTTKDKAATAEWCARRHPEANLLATERSRKPHSGICDALAIAHYGWTQERGEHAA